MVARPSGACWSRTMSTSARGRDREGDLYGSCPGKQPAEFARVSQVRPAKTPSFQISRSAAAPRPAPAITRTAIGGSDEEDEDDPTTPPASDCVGEAAAPATSVASATMGGATGLVAGLGVGAAVVAAALTAALTRGVGGGGGTAPGRVVAVATGAWVAVATGVWVAVGAGVAAEPTYVRNEKSPMQLVVWWTVFHWGMVNQ